MKEILFFSQAVEAKNFQNNPDFQSCVSKIYDLRLANWQILEIKTTLQDIYDRLDNVLIFARIIARGCYAYRLKINPLETATLPVPACLNISSIDKEVIAKEVIGVHEGGACHLK